MPQLVTIQQAACNALATWLTNELASEDVSVEPRWTEPDRQLPAKHVTIITAGPRAIEWMPAEVVKATNVTVNEQPKVDTIWSLGFLEQPVQLDVWAQSDVELDDIIARLDASLNKGAKGLGIANTEPFAAGLLLNLADGWAPGIVDFLFEEPQIMQSPASVGESEWRAMYRGRASAQMTQTARTARIARILLEQRLYEVSPVNSAEPADQTIILPES